MIREPLCCAGCDTPLLGVDKGAFVEKKRIYLRGLMSVYREDNSKDYIYLTKKTSEVDLPQLVLCLKPGIPCLEKAIQRSKDKFNARLKQFAELRDEERVFSSAMRFGRETRARRY